MLELFIYLRSGLAFVILNLVIFFLFHPPTPKYLRRSDLMEPLVLPCTSVVDALFCINCHIMLEAFQAASNMW